MKEGSLVFNNELGKGIVKKLSPTGGLVCVEFMKYGTQVVSRMSIRLINL